MKNVPNPLSYAASARRRRHSRLAVAAAVIVCGEFGFMTAAQGGEIGSIVGRVRSAAEQWSKWDDVGVQVDLAVGVLGVALCLAALFRPGRKRWLAAIVLPAAVAGLTALSTLYVMRFWMST